MHSYIDKIDSLLLHTLLTISAVISPFTVVKLHRGHKYTGNIYLFEQTNGLEISIHCAANGRLKT